MEITSAQIKALRDQTGISVMQCKKALEETGGDMAKAEVLLKQKSAEIAGKRDHERIVGCKFGRRDKKLNAYLLECRFEF